MSSDNQNKPIEAEIEEIDPSEMWSPEEREKYFSEMEENPLLMDTITDVVSSHVYYGVGGSQA